MSFVASADGPVFTGLFKFRDTHGIPLAHQYAWLEGRKLLFSVPHFVLDATKAGWSSGKITAELRESWLDRGLSRTELVCLERQAQVFLGCDRAP